MSIIVKYLGKNMFAKPFRTFLLVFCIACCSFVAMLSLDIIGNMEKMLKAMVLQALGNSDIIVENNIGVEEEYELSCRNRQLLLYSTGGAYIERSEDFYTYFHKTNYTIETMDYDTAYDMRLLGVRLDMASGEVAVSQKLTEIAGWSVGDTITLYDNGNNPTEYKISLIMPNIGLANGLAAVFMNREDYMKLGNGVRATLIYIDIENDDDIAYAKKQIEDTDFNAVASVVMDSEENKDMIKQLGVLFFMIFAVCFLLVIFVAISVSNRIVCERISVVGTFRSLGISSSYCTKLLLAENALYGFAGGIVGVMVYIAARDTIFGSILTVDATFEVNIELQPVNPLAVFGVLLLGVIVMCACPLKEIIRTSKTAIRDIIFDNKDTAYKMHGSANVIGIVCAIVAVILFFIKGSSAAQIACFVLMIVAVALLFPWILKAVATLLSRLFDKLNMPVARMAAMECYARKSTVGSAILCVTASTLAIVIFVLASTLGNIYDLDTYACDVIATVDGRQEVSRFSYIKNLEGVTDTEIIYGTETNMKINGIKSEITAFGLNEGGFKLFTAIKDCPDALGRDEFVMDKALAKKMGVKVGDYVDITFDEKSYMPITKRLRLAALVDAFDYDTVGKVIVMSKDLYLDMYHNGLSRILVKCDNPEETARKIKRYSATTLYGVETIEEYVQSWREKEAGTRGLLTVVIIFGVGLTLIGMISNQLIGFQGRKRECAVLASTAMTRGKISKMFLVESMTASGIALATALPTALAAFVPFKALMENFSATVKVTYDIKMYILFLMVLWLVFTLVALFPIRQLKKMNIALQLKYE